MYRQKKVIVDQSEFQRQSRVTCGADVIICHVLPYLIAVTVEESVSHVEIDSYASSDDESSDSTSHDESSNSMSNDESSNST